MEDEPKCDGNECDYGDDPIERELWQRAALGDRLEREYYRPTKEVR